MIYLMRHGETNPAGQKRFVGQWDLALSQTGADQARRWRQALSGVAFETVACSDLVRSVHSAEFVSGWPHSRLRIETALREIDLGSWDGKLMADIRKRFARQWQARGSQLETFRPPGGESFADLQARVLPVFLDIAAGPGNALVVAHAGVNRVILCHILGMPLDDGLNLNQDYACLNRIQYISGALQVVSLNLSVLDSLNG